jgi:hypothetical protein
MAIIHKSTFTCYFHNSDTEKQFPSLAEAQKAAESYCGNNRSTKPFPDEETYLYGPGDGSVSVMIRQDIEFIKNTQSMP